MSPKKPTPKTSIGQISLYFLAGLFFLSGNIQFIFLFFITDFIYKKTTGRSLHQELTKQIDEQIHKQMKENPNWKKTQKQWAKTWESRNQKHSHDIEILGKSVHPKNIPDHISPHQHGHICASPEDQTKADNNGYQVAILFLVLIFVLGLILYYYGSGEAELNTLRTLLDS